MSRVLSTAPQSADLLRERLTQPNLVVSLCAAWCGTCTEFDAVFERLATRWPETTFVKIDIEDDSAIAGDVDVENFPTLAVFRGQKPVHFGISLPQEGVAVRLLSALLEGEARPVTVPEAVSALPELLLQHARQAGSV